MMSSLTCLLIRVERSLYSEYSPFCLWKMFYLQNKRINLDKSSIHHICNQLHVCILLSHWNLSITYTHTKMGKKKECSSPASNWFQLRSGHIYGMHHMYPRNQIKVLYNCCNNCKISYGSKFTVYGPSPNFPIECYCAPWTWILAFIKPYKLVSS